MEYIIIVYLLVLAYCQLLFGYITCVGMQRVLRAPQLAATELLRYFPAMWLLGLLAHLSLVFLFKACGLPWIIASFAPFAPLPFFWRAVLNVNDALWQAKKVLVTSPILLWSAFHLLLGLNVNQALWQAKKALVTSPFLLWTAFHLLLGLSLFSLKNGISTPWVNNYGDLTFHLGMIHHFVFQGDFPPHYHLYAGEPLSYPFFVNLWAAVLWWPSGNLASLPMVFAFQWLTLWSCVYYFLSAGRSYWLPWLLVFGGGTYLAIVSQPEVYSWRLIGEGYPWTTWLSTIWVTQRSSLMGLAACLASASLIINSAFYRQSEAGLAVYWTYALAGAILAMTPLVHTHFFLFTSLFLGGYLFLSAVVALLGPGASTPLPFWRRCVVAQDSRIFMVFFVTTCAAVIYFPFILGKSGMTSLMAGWTVPLKPWGWDALETSALMWMKNAWQWFVALAVVWVLSKKHIAFVILLLLFVLANLVKMASWEWDQLKAFLAIFSMFLLVWGASYDQRFAAIKPAERLAHYLLAVLLVLPGLYEFGRIVKEWPSYQVYDPKKVKLAEVIREVVPVTEVVASPPDHNSAGTISGRTLFFGYPGTLASHNINYGAREQIHLNLAQIVACKSRTDFDVSLCPSYLVWDAAALNYWKREPDAANFEKMLSIPDGSYSVYRVKQP